MHKYIKTFTIPTYSDYKIVTHEWCYSGDVNSAQSVDISYLDSGINASCCSICLLFLFLFKNVI